MAEIKGVGNKKPSRRPRGVSNSNRPNGKAWKRHPKKNDVSTPEQIAYREERKAIAENRFFIGAGYNSH